MQIYWYFEVPENIQDSLWNVKVYLNQMPNTHEVGCISLAVTLLNYISRQIDRQFLLLYACKHSHTNHNLPQHSYWSRGKKCIDKNSTIWFISLLIWKKNWFYLKIYRYCFDNCWNFQMVWNKFNGYVKCLAFDSPCEHIGHWNSTLSIFSRQHIHCAHRWQPRCNTLCRCYNISIWFCIISL